MNDMIRLTKYFLLAFIAVFISACAIGPNFQKPVVDTPKQYRISPATADSLITLEWWTLFNDTVLDTFVREALRYNLDVRIAASRIEEARASWCYNRADNFPRLGYEGTIQGGNLSPVLQSGNTSVLSNYYAAPVLSWEIDFWGKYRRATESARAEMMATEVRSKKRDDQSYCRCDHRVFSAFRLR